jgi:hypothetical protein
VRGLCPIWMFSYFLWQYACQKGRKEIKEYRREILSLSLQGVAYSKGYCPNYDTQVSKLGHSTFSSVVQSKAATLPDVPVFERSGGRGRGKKAQSAPAVQSSGCGLSLTLCISFARAQFSWSFSWLSCCTVRRCVWRPVMPTQRLPSPPLHSTVQGTPLVTLPPHLPKGFLTGVRTVEAMSSSRLLLLESRRWLLRDLNLFLPVC